jgi:hypothetical protein
MLVLVGAGYAYWRYRQGLPILPQGVVMVGGTINLPVSSGPGQGTCP